MSDSNEWYQRYLSMQESLQREDTRQDRQALQARVRELASRMKALEIYVPVIKRSMSNNGMRTLISKYTAQVREAELRQARGALRAARLSGYSITTVLNGLAVNLNRPPEYVEGLLRAADNAWDRQDLMNDYLRQQVVQSKSEQQAREILLAKFTTNTTAEGFFTVQEPDPIGKDGRGRRPLPAVARVKVVGFKDDEWDAYRGAIHALEVEDVDFETVFVAVDAVAEHVRAGRVPGFALLDEDEAAELHAVLVATEHYQRGMLRQALIDGDHDPADVLALADAEGRQRQYRHRLGLPEHTYSVECCGAGLAAPERVEAE